MDPLLNGVSETVRMTELVDESLRPLRLPHDPLPVVLSDGPGELVIVHGRTVLPKAPESGHTHAVLNLEHAPTLVQPPDARTVLLRRGQELLEELPQMNVSPALGRTGGP